MNGGKRDRALESLDVVVEVKRRRLEKGKWKVVGRLMGEEEGGRRVESTEGEDEDEEGWGSTGGERETPGEGTGKSSIGPPPSPSDSEDNDDADEPEEEDGDEQELLTILRSALMTLEISDLQSSSTFLPASPSRATTILPRFLPGASPSDSRPVGPSQVPISLVEVEQAYKTLVRKLWACAALVKQAQTFKADEKGMFWRGKERLLEELKPFASRLARCILRELKNLVSPLPEEEEEVLGDEEGDGDDESIFVRMERREDVHASPLKVKPESAKKEKRRGSSAILVRRNGEETRAAMAAVKCLGTFFYEGELWKMWDGKFFLSSSFTYRSGLTD
ncbi:hypothetical protein BT69DRAFT_93944 [Atractiella rhizophila]|nr:hypothetical protein BT69DRAFT_93944 [Atractiella rhizophila]